MELRSGRSGEVFCSCPKKGRDKSVLDFLAYVESGAYPDPTMRNQFAYEILISVEPQ